MFYAKFGWNWPCSSEVDIFKKISICFNCFAFISLWWRLWAFICFYLRTICAKLGWNQPSIFKERIFKYFQCNFIICFYLPFQKGVTLHLHKLESSPLLCFCVKFRWNWHWCSEWEDFKNIFNIIFLFFYYLPLDNFTIVLLSTLGTGRCPSFEQTWISSIQECFVPSLVEIGPVVLEKKSKKGKFYRQTDG